MPTSEVMVAERTDRPMPKSEAAHPALARAPVAAGQALEPRRIHSYIALMIGDLVAIYFGLVSGGLIYLGGEGIDQATMLFAPVAAVFVTTALYNGSYSTPALLAARTGTWKAIQALFVSVTAVVFIAFYTKSSEDFSRIGTTLGVVFAAFAIVWSRAQLRDFVRWRCGGQILTEILIRDGGGQIDLPGATIVDAQAEGLVPDLEDPAALNRIALTIRNADRVIVSCTGERRLAWAMVLRGANVVGEVIDHSVSHLGAHGARMAGGLGLLRVSIGPLGLRDRATKRIFDTLFASAALLLAAPLMALIAAAILIEDGGPVFFKQRRIGRANSHFDMLKFRSMRVERNDAQGLRSASRDDDRVTRVGRLIRRTSLDELPQLINVLLGQMSIVGPRPHALGSQAGDKLFWEIDDRYWHRHALKPGITGLAQIRGLRGATAQERDLQHRLDADLEYIDGWSLWRDLTIILQTVRVLRHHNAY